MLAIPGALLALVPFRFVWNNLPDRIGMWLGLFIAFAVFVCATLAFAYILTVGWRRLAK